MDFWNALKGADNERLTENGAIGLKTSGHSLLDLNFIVPSLRKASQSNIMNLFIMAYREDKMLALKWLFFVRDIRQGMGERRLFRMILNGLVGNDEINMKELVPLIPEYGRFDDMLVLLDTAAEKITLSYIKDRLFADITEMIMKRPISLLGKWLPSTSATNKERRRLAEKIAKSLGLESRAYMYALSGLRRYLDIVECKMSANQWDKIKYESVPSKANLRYKNAFLRRDPQRRIAYLTALSNGETKINAGVLTPADIVNKYYCELHWGHSITPYDEALEQLWKALPDKVNGESGSIAVADGSASMTCTIPGTNMTALAVANALAIYFAEHSTGIFKDRYITFSQKPQFVDFSGLSSLSDKLRHALKYNEVANTNIEAVFNLILKAALDNHAQQSDMPKNVIVISDMEFDSCTDRPGANLFAAISDKYKAAGYNLPRLVFWNVNSRTNTMPIKQNDSGLCLVSGFSTNVFNMVLSGQLDPYQALVEVLESPRYKPVEAVLIKDVINNGKTLQRGDHEEDQAFGTGKSANNRRGRASMSNNISV